MGGGGWLRKNGRDMPMVRSSDDPGDDARLALPDSDVLWGLKWDAKMNRTKNRSKTFPEGDESVPRKLLLSMRARSQRNNSMVASSQPSSGILLYNELQ